MTLKGFCKLIFDPVKAGKQGRVNADLNSQRKLGVFAPVAQSSAARAMLHERWHVSRDIVNPACHLCRTSTKVPR